MKCNFLCLPNILKENYTLFEIKKANFVINGNRFVVVNKLPSELQRKRITFLKNKLCNAFTV